MRIVLQRLAPHGTAAMLGFLEDGENRHLCATLERHPSADHPCIPAGKYVAKRDWHHPNDPKRYQVWELQNVPGRSEIQIHIANKPSQLLGCIAPGESYGVMDGEPAVLNSTAAFKRFMEYTKDATTLELEVKDP